MMPYTVMYAEAPKPAGDMLPLEIARGADALYRLVLEALPDRRPGDTLPPPRGRRRKRRRMAPGLEVRK